MNDLLKLANINPASVSPDQAEGLLLSAQRAGLIYSLSGKAHVIPSELYAIDVDVDWEIQYYDDDSVLSICAGDVLCFPSLHAFAVEIAGTSAKATVPPVIDNFFNQLSALEADHVL